MKNLKRLYISFRNLPFWAKAIVVSVFIIALIFIYITATETVSYFFFNRQIQKLEKAADEKVKDANTHEEKADVWADERKEKEAEYKSRQPLRDRADRDAENTKRELERLRKEYEKAINNKPDNSNTDIAERERRAIEHGRELYPNTDKP